MHAKMIKREREKLFTNSCIRKNETCFKKKKTLISSCLLRAIKKRKKNLNLKRESHLQFTI